MAKHSAMRIPGIPSRVTNTLAISMSIATFTAAMALSSLVQAGPRRHRPNLVSGIGTAVPSPAAPGSLQASAQNYWCNCRIVQTGPGGGTVNVKLHDLAGKFPDRWFVASDSSRQQIFDAALAAVIANRSVSVRLRDTTEFSTIEVFYVNAS